MKEILNAFVHLVLFKPNYSDLPRYIEVVLGILTWINILVVVISITNLLS